MSTDSDQPVPGIISESSWSPTHCATCGFALEKPISTLCHSCKLQALEDKHEILQKQMIEASERHRAERKLLEDINGLLRKEAETTYQTIEILKKAVKAHSDRYDSSVGFFERDLQRSLDSKEELKQLLTQQVLDLCSENSLLQEKTLDSENLIQELQGFVDRIYPRSDHLLRESNDK